MSDKLKRSLVQECIELFIDEVKKEETQRRLTTYIIEPSFTFIFDRLYPYIILTALIFVLILLLTILILVFLLRRNNSI
jgi:hypothetical protein